MASVIGLRLRLRPQSCSSALKSFSKPVAIASFTWSHPSIAFSRLSSYRLKASPACHNFSTSSRICSIDSATAAADSVHSNPLLPSFLVTPQVLLNALRKNESTKISTLPRIIPLCAAWFMPNDPEKRTGRGAYLAGRIPNARFFDLDKIADTESPYPHMLPSPQVFAESMGKLGIRPDDAIVVYDTAELGIFSAPRVAWTLKVFGHDEVHVLNNFKLWVDQGLPVEKGEAETKWEETVYPVPDVDVNKVIEFAELKERIKEQNKDGAEAISIVDARSQARFEGTAAEPREGLPSGHMPSAINIPYTDVLSARTKAFLPASELKVYFECKNIDGKTPIVSTCGTGVTASVLDIALQEAGIADGVRKVYDGSWTEWGSRVDEKEGLVVTKKKAKAKA